MAICSVPLCKSRTGVSKNVSFHEFPSDQKLREAWTTNIKRDNWVPNDREGLRVRKLVAGAVPTLFPGFPTYLQSKILSDNDNANKRKPPKLSVDITKRPKLEQDIKEESHSDAEFDEFIQPRSLSATTADDQDYSPASQEIMGRTSNKKDEVISNSNSKKSFSKMKQLNNFRQQIRRLRRKIDELKTKIKKAEMENDTKESVLSKKLVPIIQDSEDGNLTASMILEQIDAYGSKVHKWTENVVRYCVILCAKSTKSYQYIRSIKLFNLPSISTLKRANIIRSERVSE